MKLGRVSGLQKQQKVSLLIMARNPTSTFLRSYSKLPPASVDNLNDFLSVLSSISTSTCSITSIFHLDFTRLKLAPVFFHIFFPFSTFSTFFSTFLQIQIKIKPTKVRIFYQRSSIYYLSNKKNSNV